MCKWGTTKKVKLMEIQLKGCTKEQHRKRAKILKLKENEERIDSCIAPLVQALNDGGINTITSCCGHGKTFGDIWLQDRILLIINDKDGYCSKSNRHKFLIKMVLNHIMGSYKTKLRIKKNNFFWRLKNRKRKMSEREKYKKEFKDDGNKEK